MPTCEVRYFHEVEDQEPAREAQISASSMEEACGRAQNAMRDDEKLVQIDEPPTAAGRVNTRARGRPEA